ncbi:MAG: recombination-associated protein RdgC [Pseudomonadota bacterium]|nr:recombination-associated protein RdgC [Pseudomonadota bacterium]
MFKSLMLYRLGPGWPATADELAQALAAEPFAPCSATQQKSTGWVPPRGVEHGALVEVVDGQWIARMTIETKAVPGDAVRRKVAEEAARIEQQQGRKPGKKELRDMRDDALMALLPHAFPRQKGITVWIDPATRIMVLDAATQSAAEEVITSLVRVAGQGFGVSMLQTATSPQAAMAAWLADEEDSVLPQAFHIERECELKASGDKPARVRFDQHNICTEEVRQHIREGKLPAKLAMGWQGGVYFTLTKKMQIKSIFIDNNKASSATDEYERFDSDVALFTGTMRQMLPKLFDVMGGIKE